MKKIIAFSGKGGVGKTTSLALFLKYILEDKNKLDVRSAWGTHITVSRFTEEIPPEQTSKFNELMKYASYPNASNDGDVLWPDSINVGFFELDKNGFNLETVKEFSLK